MNIYSKQKPTTQELKTAYYAGYFKKTISAENAANEEFMRWYNEGAEDYYADLNNGDFDFYEDDGDNGYDEYYW